MNNSVKRLGMAAVGATALVAGSLGTIGAYDQGGVAPTASIFAQATGTPTSTASPQATQGAGQGTDRPPQGQAGLRVAHMAPGAPQQVDIYVDGNRVISNLPYQQVSNLQSVAPGQHTVRVTPAGQNDQAAIEERLTLNADTITTVIATGAQGDVRALTAVNNLPNVPEGQGQLRFVHTIPSIGQVDVYNQNGDLLFEDVEFREITDYRQVPAGTYQLQVRLDGTNNTVLTIPNVNVPSRGTAAAFTTGTVAGAPVQQQPAATPTPAPTPAATPRPATPAPTPAAQPQQPAPQAPRTGVGVTTSANAGSIVLFGALALAGLALFGGAGIVRVGRRR